MAQEVDLRERVVDIIGALLPKMLGQEVTAGSDDVRLFDELGMSSSKTLELLLALEDELDIHIDIEEIEREDLASIGNLADFVAKHALAGG